MVSNSNSERVNGSGGASSSSNPDQRAAVQQHSYRPYQQDHMAYAYLDTLRQFSVQLLCAGGAGAIAKTSVAPLERVKILLQVQSMGSVPPAEQYKGLYDALQRIPQLEGGWRALFRGNGANVLRLVPEVGFKFVVHDQFRVMFAPADGSPLGVLEKLAAGVLKCCLFYPLDLARTRITADTSRVGQRRTAATVRQCLADTIRHEGITSMYKGMLPSLVGIVPHMSVSFTTYESLKNQLPDDKQSRSSWWFPFLKMGCGAAAAVTAQATCYPLDTIRRRMQMNGAQGHPRSYNSMLHCIKHMATTSGVASFYRGCLVNSIKVVPGATIQFICYDLLKSAVTTIDPTAGVQSPL
eukprot:gene30784-35825_t